MPSPGPSRLVAGVDIGSLTAKTVILSARGETLAYSIVYAGIVNEEAALTALSQALGRAGVNRSELGYIVTTGYGRVMVSFGDKNITEISCHARGAHYLQPGVRTVIDIGGQDSKAIALDGEGGVANFAMNDKCAAGTGRFLEVMARALGVPLEEMGELSLKSPSPAQVSSVCTVFAESEVISLVSQGISKVDIIAGIHEAIGRRLRGMVKTIRPRPPAMMTGGVARNRGVVQVLSRRLGLEISVPEEPQMVGALGAALFAREELRRQSGPVMVEEGLA